MPRSPQVPLVKFYSPQREDQGLIEFWSSEVAQYQPLPLGSPHPNTRDYPNFKLGKQSNLPNDQNFIVRIWVKDTTNPEWFGYSVKYLAESNSHPIFIRSDRIARATYTPKTKGQPLKAVYKLALTNAGSGYTVGTFPALTFNNSGTGGSGASGYAVVAPDQTIAELVLDIGGSGYNTAPTFTIAAPPSGTTATGTATIQPATALLVAEQANEYPEDSEFYGLYLNVVRVYQTLDGPELSGQNVEEQFGLVIPFTRQEVKVADAGIGTLNREIKPIDSVRSEIIDIDVSAFTAVLASYSLSFPGTANLDLPDELTALTGLMETSSHAGEYINDIAYGEAIDHGTWSVNVRGEGSGGGQIMPDLRIDIRQVYARNVHTTHYIFFMPSPVTAAAFLTKLAALVGASISAWPKFKPQLHTFTLVGRALDLTANVDGSASEGFDGEPLMYTAGHGTSRRSGMNIRTVKLPPTIHGSVSVATNSQTLNLATVEAHSIVGSAFPGLDEDVVLDSESIAALITPSSLSATAGASTIPATGKYLLESQSDIYKYGYVRCHAEVLDFADV